MKIALLSDIHGNSIALDAVLRDIDARGGAETYWVLGDLAALGHDPVGALERLAALPGVRFVRGNTDRYVFTGDRPPPTLEEALGDAKRTATLVEMNANFAWTQGALAVTGWFEWLGELPLELEMRLPDGTRFLGVHASPGRDDGPGFAPGDSDDKIQSRMSGCQADLICVGHTHQPMNRRLGDWHIINLGSVSNHPWTDRRASYAVITANDDGYQVDHYRVSYDLDAVVHALDRLRHPARSWLRDHFQDPA